MAYVGTPIDTRNTFQSLQGKRFNGDGSTTAFTLDVAPSSTLDIEVFVGNVRQDPNSAYTLSGTTLTFTGAPPSGTNNIYVVHQAKSVGTITPGANTVGVTELNLSDGTNGQALTTNGSGTLAFSTISGTTINNNADNRVITGSDTANTLEGESTLTYGSSNLGVGIATPTFTNGNGLHLNSVSDNLRLHLTNTATGTAAGDGADIAVGSDGALNIINKENAVTRFYTNDTERMRIDSSGNLLHAKTSNNANVVGIELRPTGELTITRTNNQLLDINRTDNDGTLVTFRQANATEGTISVSGATVSYNSFAGSHWSRLADNSKPTILRGTIMESISTLMDWYQVEYTKDEETLTEYIGALPDGKSVGDSHTVTVDGVEYTGIISKEDNERLPKCKISDTEDSKAVYGVFMDWDNDDDNVNDMYITSLGAYVVRIHKDETVAIGDYLQSKGDGTAKVQADDILRASTIAKVTSTTKTITHSDGSYCVPCTLHCG